jgi:hypothetical protein
MLVNPISRQKLIAVKDPDTRVTLLLSRSKTNMIKESYNVNVLTFNIFILFQSFNLLSEIWNSGLSFHVTASVLYVS